MNVYRIPVGPVQQIFEIELAQKSYHIRIYFNKFMQAWLFDLLDGDKNPLIMCTPLVTGVNILEQYAYLGVDGVFIVYSEGDHDHVPGLTELGSGSGLYYLTE